METQADRQFLLRLEEWRQALSLGHNAFARHLGISGPYWHQLRTGVGGRRPSQDLVNAWIARASEPWKSALRQARQADQDAAVAAMAVA